MQLDAIESCDHSTLHALLSPAVVTQLVKVVVITRLLYSVCA